ncbi:hypothetical protein KM043_011485 [Ampulex compressa]|nr:hypothetical protein KM043_011485 [Ampulex compressa]
MKTPLFCLICLTAGALAGDISYPTSSPSRSSIPSNAHPGQQWSWSGEGTVSDAGQENYGSSFAATGGEVLKNEESYNTGAQADTLANAPQSQRSMESVIDDILVSSRQGRNLAGYDEVYSDPAVKTALQIGNETIARTYIKDKLCSLGLMSCEDIEGRRPYYSPHRGIHPQDIIYAQPVTIKPVGKPLPAIPVKRPYGAGRPIPLSPNFGNGAPSLGYGPSHLGGASFVGSLSRPPPPSFVGPYPSFKKPGIPSFASKPIYEPGLDLDYEDKFIDKKQVVLQQPSASGVQQHVHHHYHHGDANGAAPSGSLLPSSSIGLGSLGSYGYGNGGTYGATISDFEDYKKAFKVKAPANGLSSSSSSNNYAEQYPVYEKPGVTRYPEAGKIANHKNGKNYGTENYFSSGGYRGENLIAPSNGLGSLGGGFNKGFQAGFPSVSYESCSCVPFERCSAGDHAGRKDDLYLAIDPRNLGKNIEAEAFEGSAVEGNGTIVRVVKHIEMVDGEMKTDSGSSIGGESSLDAGNNNAHAAKRTKRDVGEIKSSPAVKEETQGRLFTKDLDTSKLNVKPTWGISFGLPQSGSSHPIGPYADGPYENHYSGYGSNGINLGPVSVNPLVAVQVTKDEYGDKLIKPFVNLHVTPNQRFVHKLESLLYHKKHGYHGESYAPHYYPPAYQRPTIVHKPVHSFPTNPYESYYGAHRFEPHRDYRPRPYVHQHSDYTDYYQNYDDYDEYPGDDDLSFRQGSRRQGKAHEENEKDTRGSSDKKTRVESSKKISFPSRKRRDTKEFDRTTQERQFGGPPACGPGYVCCPKHRIVSHTTKGQCGTRFSQGVNGRIKTLPYANGESEFGEYPWQVAILKKDTAESVYVCGGTLISPRHIVTAAHCVKTHAGRDLRVRLGEWDVNHDVEFYPYIERDVVSVYVHPEFYAGTLYNDIAILKIDHEVNFERNPHISPACLPNQHDDFVGNRCWTTGWGKDAFGEYGKYQNILKEVDVPVVSNQVCERQMRNTRLGGSFKLHPGFICAGGEEGKDACKGDGGGPMVCERNGRWQLAGVVSWGIGCGQSRVPGVYTRVGFYRDWILEILNE